MNESNITRLLPRAYAALDEHRFGDLAPLYDADVRATTPGGEFTGTDALIAQARRNHESIPNVQHLVATPLIDTQDDTATLRANIVAIFATVDGDITYELGSVWRGAAHRTEAAGWRISDFTITPTWHRGTRPTP